MDSPPRGVFPATIESARILAENIREEHQREIADLCGISSVDAVLGSLAASEAAYEYRPAGAEPVFMMGVEAAGALTGSSLVWMLGTEAISRHGAGVLRAARWGVRRGFAATGAVYLEQFIPAWYETGLHFVRRLGFSIAATPVRGRSGSVVMHATLWKF